HQFAEDVYQCVRGKFLNSNSVGFIPVESVNQDDKKAFADWQETLEKDFEIPKDESGKAKNIYTKWIMLEHSDVPVASNAQSLNLAVSKGDLPIQSDRLKKDLEIEVVKDGKDREIEITIEDEEDVEKIHKAHVGTKVANESADKIVEVLVGKDEPTTIFGRPIVEIDSKDFFDELVEDGIITKPETTENYHRIPIESPDKHKGHRIRTIDISASKGIKALYCGECKRVITYLFDVEKWTMAEAKKWVAEHKPKYHERWNKSFSKLFDIASAESSKPLRFHYDLYEKFLECKVKEIFQNGYVIPSPLLGTYLAGFKEILGEFDLKDTRKFSYDGSEIPPDYEVIQLNSEKSDDFLISGMCFYEAEKKPLIVNFSPDFYGLTITLTTSNENKEWNKDLLDKVHSWVYENNFLKGEKFSLSGEFL
ncbi:unnamed protein product, partial [marine sediment metagenome]